MKQSTQAWIELADKDIKAAKKLVNDDYLANIVLFHCQQCIEKSLKAILEESNLDVPRIHGIHRLNTLIKEKAKYILPISDDEIDSIDDIYIDTRYPSNFGLLPSGFPSKEEAEKFITLAEKVYNSTIKSLNKFKEL